MHTGTADNVQLFLQERNGTSFVPFFRVNKRWDIEHLVDGVDHNIFRGNILEIDLIDAGAVFHVVRHPRRRDDEVNGQRRVCLQL